MKLWQEQVRSFMDHSTLLPFMPFCMRRSGLEFQVCHGGFFDLCHCAVVCSLMWAGGVLYYNNYDAGPLCYVANLGQVKLCCPELSILDRLQGHYIGYAGIEIGSIPVLHCISTAF